MDEKEAIEKALQEETGMVKRQALLKRLWKFEQRLEAEDRTANRGSGHAKHEPLASSPSMLA